MKDLVELALSQSLLALEKAGVLSDGAAITVHVERTKNRDHGDFASNVAMALAKQARMNPRELAAKIIEAIPSNDAIIKMEIAGPGFINFTLAKDSLARVIDRIAKAGADYGRSDVGAGTSVQVEFVSANPTGPLHVGHGRGAAYGDALMRLLRFSGYDADAEYYVNDAGRQMHILALSVWLRYLDLSGETIDAFPPNGYKGDYIWDIAADLHRENGDVFRVPAAELFADLPEDDEARVDELIARAKSRLGAGYETVFDQGLNTLVDDIRGDLGQFGVTFDQWFSEHSLETTGAIEAAISVLKDNNTLYEKEGAWWFRSSDYGDEKDRVVLRANGQHTYFAADIAYLLNKHQRGYHHLIYVLGADHHGYVTRVKAAFSAFGQDPERLRMLLVQFAILYRNGEKASMSTRSGDFVTLRELRSEVGNDAARFFYTMRKPEQHMDFDLDLAKSQSSDNPVYYVQYAHARVCAVFRQLAEKGLQPGENADYGLLTEQHELDLMTQLARFPEVVEKAAKAFEPHQIAYYLRELANQFHTYYNAHPFIAEDAELRNARLALINAARQVLANGLQLVGVSAPETM